MSETTKEVKAKLPVEKEILLKAWELMSTAKRMSDLYNENIQLTSKYVHATSRGHEAAQLALALQLKPQDFVAPYYRDDSILLGIGMRPYDLMLQLFAKREDPFSGGSNVLLSPIPQRSRQAQNPASILGNWNAGDSYYGCWNGHSIQGKARSSRRF